MFYVSMNIMIVEKYMTKRKFSILTLAVCFILITSIICGCNVVPTDSNNNSASSGSNGNENNTVSEYKLTVEDKSGYLTVIEELQEQYKAGEEVTVIAEMVEDVDLGLYLDGVFLGLGSKVHREIDSQWRICWEFYFTMPSHDAALSFQIPDGLTRDGLILDEAVQTEIKLAFYNSYKDKYPNLGYEHLALRCYGAFDGVYVIFEDKVWDCIDMVTSETVAGVRFVYPDGLHMTVYCDGAFYKLSEAYENNILSYDNLLATKETYRACHTTSFKEANGPEPKHLI